MTPEWQRANLAEARLFVVRRALLAHQLLAWGLLIACCVAAAGLVHVTLQPAPELRGTYRWSPEARALEWCPRGADTCNPIPPELLTLARQLQRTPENSDE